MSGMDDWNTKPGEARPVVTKISAAATLTPSQKLIEVDTDALSNFTITLPPLAMLPHGHTITLVAQGDTNAADVTIAAHGVGALDGDGVEFGALSPIAAMEDGEILTVMAMYGQRWVVLEDTTKAATMAFTGAVTVAGTLGVTGATTLSNNVTVASALTVAGASTCSGLLNVVGATTITGTTTASGAFNAVGAVALTNSSIKIANIPTSDPSVAGALWKSDIYVVMSAG